MLPSPIPLCFKGRLFLTPIRKFLYLRLFPGFLLQGLSLARVAVSLECALSFLLVPILILIFA